MVDSGDILKQQGSHSKTAVGVRHAKTTGGLSLQNDHNFGNSETPQVKTYITQTWLNPHNIALISSGAREPQTWLASYGCRVSVDCQRDFSSLWPQVGMGTEECP